jgi:hypothetical protein
LRFTAHRPGQRPASPRSHRPPGGDVASRVHISMAVESTGHAPEYRLALAVLRCDMAADGALLRRVRGVDLLNPAGCFVLQPLNQQTPPGREDASVQPSLAGDVATRLCNCASGRTSHIADAQVLHTDQVESTSESGRSLLAPVLSTITLPGTEARQPYFDLRPPIRASLRSSQATLQQRPSPYLGGRQARNDQQFSSREGGGHRNAAVDTDDCATARCTNRFRHRCKCDVPPTCPVAGYPVGLRTRGHRLRKSESDPADLRHPHLAGMPVQTPHVLGFQPDLAKTLMHTRLAPRKLGTSFGQLTTLLSIVRRRRTARLPVRVLLHRQVPHKPGLPAVLRQPGFLTGCGKQPKARHSSNLTATPDRTRHHAAGSHSTGTFSSAERGSLHRLELP